MKSISKKNINDKVDDTVVLDDNEEFTPNKKIIRMDSVKN